MSVYTISKKFEHYFEALNTDLKELVQLSNGNYMRFSDKLRAYITFCQQKTKFENILISRIDDGRYTVVDAISADNLLHGGQEFPLENTVCYRAFQTKKTIMVAKTKGTELYDLPGSSFLNANAVICSPIIVDDKAIGALTLCSNSEKENLVELEYFTNLVDLVSLHFANDFRNEKQQSKIEQSNQKLQSLNHQLNKLANVHINNKNEDDILLGYINLAKEITGFENGFISYVNEQHYEIIQSSTLNNKLEKGAVFQLCDTLCQEVIDKKATVFHCSLNGKPQYSLPGRAFLNTEAVIGLPVYLNGEVWGTFTLCSITEKKNFAYPQFEQILALIVQKISRTIYDLELKATVKANENLLQLGEDFLKIASYKRYLSNNRIDCTHSFHNIFDLPAQQNILPKNIIKYAMNKVVDEDKPLVAKMFKLSKHQNVAPFEYRILTNNRKIKWLRHQIKLDKDGPYVFGVIQDITDLKQTELNLKSKNEELEQLAYASAHDLQEPLKTITGFIEVLQNSCKNKLDDTAQQYFTFIDDASQRMKQQVDGILDHFRIGNKKQKTTINLSTLVSYVINDLKASIDQAKAKIEVAALPQINGYETELSMLFINLIGNAIKFRDKHRRAEISITCEEEQLYWKFYIADNGIGISKNNIPKIFKMFGRLNERTEYEGTGIGLAQVKKIIDLHQGQIEVSSESNKGSTFIFTIKK